MLSRIGARARSWVLGCDPFTNVYGTARTLLACGTLLTLVVNDASILFHPFAGGDPQRACDGLAGATLFCRLAEHRDTARWIAIALLAVVASGWRPRVTGLVHWWVTWSLQTSGTILDGGDQVAAVLTLALVPVTLADGRRWHWDRAANSEPAARLVAISGLVAIRVQVAAIYFHAAVGKLAVTEWVEGTAAYYIFTDAMFGLGSWAEPWLAHPTLVVAFTWGTLLLEILLFSGLVMDRRWRPALLVLGLSFHAAIAVVHGLVSFCFAMWAALILFLHPVDRPIAIVQRGVAAWRSRVVQRGRAAGVCVAVLAGGSGCTDGDHGTDPRCADVHATLERIVDLDAAPGIVVASRTPQGDCEAAVGVADLATDLAIRPGIPFAAGSVTKVFVADVRERLEAAGTDLDPHVPAPWRERGITVEQLVTHTSGMADYSASEAFWAEVARAPGRVWQPEELLAFAAAEPLVVAPGTAFHYSSSGYIALGLAMEAATGRPLGALIDALARDDAGLDATQLSMRARLDLPRGYERGPDGARIDVANLLDPSALWAAGGLVSTAPDLRTYIAERVDAAALDDAVDTGDALWPLAAAGLRARVTALGTCWGHDGHLPGAATIALHCPERDTTLVLFMNQNAQEFEVAVDFVLDRLGAP